MRKKIILSLAVLLVTALFFSAQLSTSAEGAAAQSGAADDRREDAAAQSGAADDRREDAAAEERERLKKQLETVQREIGSYQGAADERRTHAQTLEEEIGLLVASIVGEQEDIAERTKTITALSGEIRSRESEIKRLEGLSEQRRRDLAQALQEFVEEDNATLLEVLLAGHTMSEGVERLETLTQLQSGIGLELDNLRALQHTIIGRVNFLDEQRGQEYELRRVQQLASVELERKRQSKDKLLNKTKGEERRYQELITQSQATAQAIRQQLYVLEGVGVTLRFEEALALGERAEALTGIRPAFLLAVLQKESRWGQHQGTGTWRQDMHPRDHAAFLAVTKELGLNPDAMPVSKKPWYGWGGAMGPAQFLPATWLSYKDEVARLTGESPANPWNITHAFIAGALKLSRAGATARTPEGEWKAAMIYFAGKNWQDKSYAFYGNSVMEFAEALQDEINVLKLPAQ